MLLNEILLLAQLYLRNNTHVVIFIQNNANGHFLDLDPAFLADYLVLLVDRGGRSEILLFYEAPDYFVEIDQKYVNNLSF